MNGLMRGDVGGHTRLAMRFEIFGRSHDHAAGVADMARHQTRIGQMPDAHREIDSLLDQIDDAIRQPQFAGHRRIAQEIGRHDRTDVMAAERRRRRDDEAAGGRCALRLRRCFGLLEIGENAPRPLQITRADVGQRHRARGPLQQTRADMLFERGDLPRHARGGQAELARGRRKSLEIGNRHEGVHGIDTVHGFIS